MLTSTIPELAVKVSAPQWPCVLDPALALSRFGPAVARLLSDVVQLWVVREFWHILDSSEFYTAHPEVLMDNAQASEKLEWTIKTWERIRLENDLGGLKLFWIGDGLSESLLPEGVGTDVSKSYESLASALDRRIEHYAPVTSAIRDATALTAALGKTFLLTLLPQDCADGEVPSLCRTLRSWKICCEPVKLSDPIVEIERNYLRALLVQAGLANFIWAGLRLAAVRIVLPNVPLTFPAVTEASDAYCEEKAILGEEEGLADPWDAARVFWYPI